MNEERKGQIAWSLLKFWAMTKGLRFSFSTKADLDLVAHEADIPQPELQEFAKIFIGELVEENFGK